MLKAIDIITKPDWAIALITEMGIPVIKSFKTLLQDRIPEKI